jgi:Zn finger protein HypA/HybF involved in hydrogenase expression
MGELSANVDDSVQFHWDIIAKGTLDWPQAHNSAFVVYLQCQSCSEKFHPESEHVCSHCGGEQVKIIAGEKFDTETIDID